MTLTEERVRALRQRVEPHGTFNNGALKEFWYPEIVALCDYWLANSTRPSGVVDDLRDGLLATLIEFAEYNATPQSEVGRAADALREDLKQRRTTLTHPAQPECPDCGNTIAIIDDGKNKECACGVWPNNDASAPSARGEV